MRAFSLGSVKQLNKPSRGPRPTAQTPRADDPRALDRAQRAPINRAQPVPVIRDPRAIDVSSRTPAGESYPTSDRHRPDIRSTPARHQNPRSWTAIRGPRSLQIARVPPISGQKPPVLRRKTCPKPAARGLRTEGLGHVSHEYSLVISNEP